MEPQRIVPATGIALSDAQRRGLADGAAKLAREIADLRALFQAEARLSDLLSDVEIYYNAVRYALDQDIFYEEGDVPAAEGLLVQGAERAAQLREGAAPWASATGLIVRGYRSDLDGSVQPYGLVVPDSFDPAGRREHRLDVWHHGRNNKLSELRFIHERQTQPGQFTPKDAFVLHTYGRFCNAMKFAGEVDTFEALAHAKRHYPIDADRIAVRGFSMGGAATWHQAVHHAGVWAAATPGAGFAETAIYQNAFAKDPQPPVWEQKLWRLYDATGYAGNLHQCPTIAYSGENDKQKQAADMMAEHMKKEGLDLVHIIGPGVEHKYHPDSKVDIADRLDKIVAKGRNRVPQKIRFTTYTLRYNRMLWVRVDGLEKHWEEARVEAEIADQHTLSVTTQNVAALTLDLPGGICPLSEGKPKVIIDGSAPDAPAVTGNQSWTAHFAKGDAGWVCTVAMPTGLRKTHGLQGPIDDAFMDSFLMATPTGKPMANRAVTEWIAAEQADAVYQWHMQFRGMPRVKADRDVTEEDLRDHHLVLWGDPESNALLKQIAHALPIRWEAQAIVVGDRRFSADRHVPVMIFPNPLNARRYVVLNSGFTFSRNGSQSNASQTPKLPDWAVIDIAAPASERYPAGVAACDFFGERWELI